MEAADVTPLDAAREYVRRGWRVVPLPYKRKRALIDGWQNLRLEEADLPEYFDQPANIGLILGEPSGWLVDVDLDCPEAVALAAEYLPATPLVSGRPTKPRSHWWYVAAGTETTQHRDPVTNDMIVELRSTGAQTVVGPSIHPDDGDHYEIPRGEPTVVPAPMLAACVAALARRVVELRYGTDVPKPKPPRFSAPAGERRRDLTPQEIERRALAYLAKMPPAISGQGGHPATYAAATALVHGFELEPDHALAILLEEYNPRCEPPWTEKELRHKVEDAATKPHDRPRGWLLADRELPVETNDVDVSAIVNQVATINAPRASPAVNVAAPAPENTDPGPIPLELLRVPGFVSEVMDHCLSTAPYPNQALAFCGAVALQAFLAGRKVRDQADNRTNLYLLGLAHSAAGKDWPRKVNTRILHQVGLETCLGDQFASGEGLEDALVARPCMLFQTDEIDSLLQSINRAQDARHESIMKTLLTIYSSANSIVTRRKKAENEPGSTINQPCLVVFGTAIPNHYYEALSERMLTNGFIARTLIVESGKRGAGQEPRICDLPQRVLETARWWAEFHPGTGNLETWNPRPVTVEYDAAGHGLLIETRKISEVEYDAAEARGDPVGTTVWGRLNENTRKLALVHAVSVNPRAPVIDAAAARWATDFALYQTRRMLFMTQSHVADNPFHKECLKFLKKVREAPEQTLPHQVLLKRMKLDAQTFHKLVETLIQQGDVEVTAVKTTGRSGIAYRLIPPTRG